MPKLFDPHPHPTKTRDPKYFYSPCLLAPSHNLYSSIQCLLTRQSLVQCFFDLYQKHHIYAVVRGGIIISRMVWARDKGGERNHGPSDRVKEFKEIRQPLIGDDKNQLVNRGQNSII